MAIRNKFIHFKTRAAFNSYLETHADDLYNYITFIKETKEIYTHGQFYKSSNRWAISSLTGNSDYATLAYNNGKVGDIFDMSSSTTVHGILGTINDKKWYIFYKDSIREYIYNTDTKKFTAGATINLANDSEIPDPATVAPKMDGTAAVGSSNKYAREDHVHPSDNTKQDTLVSGESIRTINNLSLLGKGNIDTPDSKVTSAANHYTPVRGSATSGTIINSITKDEKGHIIGIGVANGIDAGKITSGVIDIERLPKGALERLVIVANQSERYALTADDVQEGDTVKQEDTGVMYFVVDIDNLANEDGYSIYTAGAASSVPWSGVTGKPNLVNSVKLVLPSSIFINSKSTLTGNAELGSSLSTQNANTVWAAPSGKSGVPTFRKLTFLDMNTVTSDEFNYIPQTFKGGRLVINYKNSAGGQNTDNTITEYQFGDGASNLTYITAKGFKTSENQEHRVLCSNGSSKLLYGPSTPGTAGQVLISNGSSTPEWGKLPIASLSNSGVITTEAQEISGEKYFNNGVFVGLSGSVSRGIIDGKAFGYDGLAIVSDSNVYIAPDNNIVYFGYDGDTYIQDGVFSGTASKANMVTGALTIHSGSTNITYNGSKTEEITIPRNRQTNLTRQAYWSDSSISVKKGICYYHNTGSLWATSINISLNTADWRSIESTNDTEIIETSMVVVESAYPVTFSSNSMLKVQKDIPLTGDTGTYRVYVFSRITPTLVAVNCAVYKAS